MFLVKITSLVIFLSLYPHDKEKHLEVNTLFSKSTPTIEYVACVIVLLHVAGS